MTCRDFEFQQWIIYNTRIILFHVLYSMISVMATSVSKTPSRILDDPTFKRGKVVTERVDRGHTDGSP